MVSPRSISLRSVQTVFETLAKAGGFDRHTSRVRIVTASSGSLTALMKVEHEDANRGGFLHGAMSGLLVDSLSSAGMITNIQMKHFNHKLCSTALLSHPQISSAGVSISINLTYLKSVPVGEEILIKASTDKLGRRLAFLNVEIFSKNTGDLLVKGSHTKYIGGE